jgi:hypothetical protein
MYASACVSTSVQTTARAYFQFYIVNKMSSQAYRLLRPFTVAERSENDYFDTQKLIIAVENIFWDRYVSPHIYYEDDL